jgi:hypothetical protein
MDREDEVEDDAIRALLRRLGRPHPSGGTVIERASLLSAGADFGEIMAWMVARGVVPEEAVSSAKVRHGLHGSRLHETGSEPRTPSRYVLPAGALD